MKKIIFVICMLSSLSVQAMIELLEGEYLATDYMESIKKTFSTHFDFEKINGCSVTKKQNDISIVVTNHFHEGLGEFTLFSDGTIKNAEWLQNAKKPKLKILNKKNFIVEWEMDEFDSNSNNAKKIIYKGQCHFIGEEKSAWIAKQILEGTYRSTEGSEVKFKSNNFACLPNGEKKYNVHPDVFEGSFPYDAMYHHFIEQVFEVRDYGLGFSRIGDELLLYYLIEKEGSEYVVESMPFWRGTRINADPNQPCKSTHPQAQVSSKVRQLLESLKETKNIENDQLIQRFVEEIKQTATILPHNKLSRKYNEKGLYFLKEKKYTEAVKAFNEAYHNDLQDIEINNNLGYAYLLLEANIHAEAFLLKTLSLDPTRTTAWANLAEYYLHHQQSENVTACILLAFYFSKNPSKTISYFKELKQQLTPHKTAMLEQALIHPFVQQRLTNVDHIKTKTH